MSNTGIEVAAENAVYGDGGLPIQIENWISTLNATNTQKRTIRDLTIKANVVENTGVMRPAIPENRNVKWSSMNSGKFQQVVPFQYWKVPVVRNGRIVRKISNNKPQYDVIRDLNNLNHIYDTVNSSYVLIDTNDFQNKLLDIMEKGNKYMGTPVLGMPEIFGYKDDSVLVGRLPVYKGKTQLGDLKVDYYLLITTSVDQTKAQTISIASYWFDCGNMLSGTPALEGTRKNKKTSGFYDREGFYSTMIQANVEKIQLDLKLQELFQKVKLSSVEISELQALSMGKNYAKLLTEANKKDGVSLKHGATLAQVMSHFGSSGNGAFNKLVDSYTIETERLGVNGFGLYNTASHFSTHNARRPQNMFDLTLDTSHKYRNAHEAVYKRICEIGIEKKVIPAQLVEEYYSV